MHDDVGHEEYFVPRLEPWQHDAIAALGTSSPLTTRGSIAVPFCGPGRTLQLLAEALPEREIVGVDASLEMCSRARRRCRRFANVRVEHADPTHLAAHWSGQTGAVLSCFGLQDTAAPTVTISDWTRCLAPGGRLVVLFWPMRLESPSGPFFALRELIETETGNVRDTSWERSVQTVLEAAGAKLLDDTLVSHEMEHPHASMFFDAFANSPSGRAIALEHGFEVVDRVRTKFVARMPEGPLRHALTARRLVAERPMA